MCLFGIFQTIFAIINRNAQFYLLILGLQREYIAIGIIRERASLLRRGSTIIQLLQHVGVLTVERERIGDWVMIQCGFYC